MSRDPRDCTDFSAFEAQAILPLLAAKQWDEALIKCMEAYQEAIYRYVVSMLDAGDVSEPQSTAEELVQDTFLIAWRRFATFAGRSTVRTWLFGIAIRTLRNFLAQRGRHNQLEEKNFDRICALVGVTWLQEELPRTPVFAQQYWEELRQRSQAQAWEEYIALSRDALQELRRRSTRYHFLIEKHVYEGQSFTWLARHFFRSRAQIREEFEKAKAMFIKIFLKAIRDKENGP